MYCTDCKGMWECDFVFIPSWITFFTKSKTFDCYGTKEEDQDEGLPAASQEHPNNNSW